ncbi:MAG: GAF domain-containing protein [Myxococcales bacterium]|nr:GAF domain-containing protein [Myxococcales bacterium]
MDLRTRTSLFCGALAIAIAVSILLRGRLRRPQIWFAGFAADIGLWYLAQWLYHFVRADVWVRFTAILAVLLPQFGLRLFEALVPERERRSTLLHVAGVLLLPVAAVALLVPLAYWWVRSLVFVYAFGLLGAGLWSLGVQAASTRSRLTQRRVRFLVFVGALAVAASLADFLWFLGFDVPPIGAVCAILFLFVLSESLIRQRFVDLYDVVSQVAVSAALASCLAGIFYAFVVLFGGFDTMYLAAFLATIVILVLFEPLREKANAAIHRAFFRERVDLDRAVTQVRGELAHVLRIDQLEQVVMGALAASHRATGAALYLRDDLGLHYELVAQFGPRAPRRIDAAMARPLLDRLNQHPSVVLEEVVREVALARSRGWSREADAHERVLAAAELLEAYKLGVCTSLRGEQEDLLGFLVVMDDRVADAYSPDEVHLLEGLALQIAVVVENSRQYQRMQARDRLALLGQMAAGLAHEVKNPLGAIKGAAQLLSDPGASSLDANDREFVGIILEEVDRLDRVVGSVLDYARPATGEPGELDVNSVVERTLRVLSSESSECRFEQQLAPWLPPVRGDAEQLRQVLINLVRNAVQAMQGRGTVTVSTRGGGEEPTSAPRWIDSSEDNEAPRWVEITVSDQGPGLDPRVMKNLFVPFVTTKDRGTGLGLAISQRIVEEMGGRIEVSSQPGQGSAFSVVLPAAQSAARPPVVRPAAGPGPAPAGARSPLGPLGALPEQPEGLSSTELDDPAPPAESELRPIERRRP